MTPEWEVDFVFSSPLKEPIYMGCSKMPFRVLPE